MKENAMMESADGLLRLRRIVLLLLGCAIVASKGTEVGPAAGKVVVLLLNKASPSLAAVVTNALTLLPQEWTMQIFYMSEELDVVLRNIDVLQPYLKENRLHLTYVTRKEPPSLLLKDESFWTLIEGEHVLMMEPDTILCPNSPHKIDHFMEYDVVSAPFRYMHQLLAGAGGLALRRKSVTIKALSLCKQFDLQWENADYWWAHCFRMLSEASSADAKQQGFAVKFPSRETAMQFSVESVYYEQPFGIHQPWVYLTIKEMEELVVYCPEVMSIIPIESPERPKARLGGPPPPWAAARGFRRAQFRGRGRF